MNMHAQSTQLTCVWQHWRRYLMFAVTSSASRWLVPHSHHRNSLRQAVARLLRKSKVRVARHLQVYVEAHQMQLRAHHANE